MSAIPKGQPSRGVDIKHMRPRYYAYRAGDYSNVRLCRGCGAVSLTEDQPMSYPCSHCGWRATDRDVFVMRWVSSAIWWKPATWGRGEWRDPEQGSATDA